GPAGGGFRPGGPPGRGAGGGPPRHNTDPDVVGTRAALDMIGSHPRLTGTAIQTVGTKGYDGFALARVLA
ncbi:hypothetical protein AB8O53_32750, partial [Streptomyces pilosus]